MLFTIQNLCIASGARKKLNEGHQVDGTGNRKQALPDMESSRYLYPSPIFRHLTVKKLIKEKLHRYSQLLDADVIEGR